MVYYPGFNKQEWRPRAVNMPANTVLAHSAGVSMCSDLRNNETRDPSAYMLYSATALYRYNVKPDGWGLVGSPALAGTFGAGACCVFDPDIGPSGTIGAGCSTTKIVTSSVITTVAVNQLAGRGADSKGYIIRITGKTVGKTEEAEIVANTSGTTPIIYLKTALSFTPSNLDTFKILSGRVYMLSANTLAAGLFKYYDLATNTFSGNLATTNLPATIGTDSSIICLAEQYVPNDRAPGEGFFGVLTATASAAGTLTGQAALGDAVVLQNEYRNFQIRITEDTAIPAAVGQIRVIVSHTAGASPIYSLSANWTNTPTATAKYVIENPRLIILFTSANVATFVYNPNTDSITNGTGTVAADAWSATYFGNRTAPGLGVTTFPSFGLSYDPLNQSRHSYIWSFRGAGTLSLDMLDIAGAIAGTWTNGIAYNGSGPLLTTGTCGRYCPATSGGKYGYLTFNNTNNFFRFDVQERSLVPYTQLRFPQAGTAAAGDRVCSTVVYKDATKYSMLLFLGHLSGNFFDLVIVENDV
jgi:hypothetical protein